MKKAIGIAICLTMLCSTCAFAGEISSQTFKGVRQAPRQEEKTQQQNKQPAHNTQQPPANNYETPERPQQVVQQQRIDVNEIVECAQRYVSCFEEARQQRRLAPLNEYTKNLKYTDWYKTEINCIGSAKLLCSDVLQIEREGNEYKAYVWMKFYDPDANPIYRFKDTCHEICFSATLPLNVTGVSTSLIKYRGIPGRRLKGKYVMISNDRGVYNKPGGHIIFKVPAKKNLFVVDVIKKVDGHTWYFIAISEPTVIMSSNHPTEYGWGWVPVESIAKDDSF